jgi:hypothetical protein
MNYTKSAPVYGVEKQDALGRHFPSAPASRVWVRSDMPAPWEAQEENSDRVLLRDWAPLHSISFLGEHFSKRPISNARAAIWDECLKAWQEGKRTSCDLLESFEDCFNAIQNDDAKKLGVDRAHIMNEFVRWCRPNLSAILECLLADEKLIQDCSDKSYEHLNGFDKYVLIKSSKSSWVLRLHIWWPDKNRGYQENMHIHRWAFASCLVAGSLCQDVMEVGPGEKEELLKQYEYRNRGDTKNHRYESTGEDVLVHVEERCTFKSDQSYVFPLNRKHRVVQVEGADASVTIVLTAPSEQFSTIWTKHDLSEEDQAPLISVDAVKVAFRKIQAYTRDPKKYKLKFHDALGK